MFQLLWKFTFSAKFEEFYTPLQNIVHNQDILIVVIFAGVGLFVQICEEMTVLMKLHSIVTL